MQEMNKVQRALDKVMDLQHRIVNSIASMAERECNREPIREIEEGLLLKEFEKLAEYYEEVREAVEIGDKEKISDELSDLLFSCVNVARFAKIDSEQALYNGCEKFIRRFEAVENKCNQAGNVMNEMSPEKLDKLWNEVKKDERF